MVLLDLSDESLEEPLCDFVGAVVVLSVAGEVAFHLEVVGHVGCEDSLALLVRDVDVAAKNLNLGVLDGAERVDNVAEARDSCRERAADVCVDKGQLGGLVVVFVVHVVDGVESVDIQAGEPFKHCVILFHDFVVVQVLACDRRQFRTNLRARSKSGLFVLSAVDGVEQGLGQVGAGSEELHFFSCLCG